jgi:hypothetical protein
MCGPIVKNNEQQDEYYKYAFFFNLIL